MLEDALRSCHCQGSAQDLLSEDLLQVKEAIDEIFVSDAAEVVDEEESPSHSSTFGTLSVSDGRNLRYFGRSATAVSSFLISGLLFIH